MAKIEFRVSPDGKVYFTPEGEKERRLSRFEKGVIDEITCMIMHRFPGAWARLRTIYPEASKSRVDIDKAYYKAVERFIRCNFGEHDMLTPDIEHDILNFEEVRCPLRGICPEENVICKPRSMIRLSEAEREVVKYYLMGYTFKEIADMLGKSPDTIKSQLYSIKKKTGAKNCREIIKIVRLNRLM